MQHLKEIEKEIIYVLHTDLGVDEVKERIKSQITDPTVFKTFYSTKSYLFGNITRNGFALSRSTGHYIALPSIKGRFEVLEDGVLIKLSVKPRNQSEIAMWLFIALYLPVVIMINAVIITNFPMNIIVFSISILIGLCGYLLFRHDAKHVRNQTRKEVDQLANALSGTIIDIQHKF